MSERVSIAEPLREICDRLGIDYASVRQITFEPRSLTAVVYRRRDGGKYLDDDGEPAVDELRFDVAT